MNNQVYLKPHTRSFILSAAFLLAVATLAGAFGAHALEAIFSEKQKDLWETGIRYHFYHALALLGLANAPLDQWMTEKTIRNLLSLFLFGIFFFSGNCYLYALTQVKFFALLVPFGGTSFVIAWITLFWKFTRAKRP
jgi:uncharacterized membrane protein YgdD (TMEM256/DUF423 family)